jgi:hypothetical protein
MSEFLLYYKRPDPTTWVYLSSFLTIGLFFVFHRFWSVRNLDIALLILLAPGLLMVHEGRRRHLRMMEANELARRDAATDSESTRRDQVRLEAPSWKVATAKPPAGADAPGPHSTPPPKTVSQPAVFQPAVFQPAVQLTGARAGVGEEFVAASGVLTNPSMLAFALQGQAGGPGQSSANPDAEGTATNAQGTEPTIQEETNIPLVANPEALDERLEATAREPDPTESDAELAAKGLQRGGFIWLFAVELIILVRLLIDPLMVRRPLLDPNLTVGGLYFICISLFVFMMANVVTSTPRTRVWQGPQLGPGYALMHRLPKITTRPISAAPGGEDEATADELDLAKRSSTILAKVLAIASHLAIIVGLMLIGNRHFGNLRAGVGCALLYLMLPYTAQMTGRVDHALPAALLLWAILNYRRPAIAGVFLGLAGGLVYYPLFLLPLWCSFYWQRGVRRFAVGVIVTLTILIIMLSFGGTDSLIDHLRRMFGLFVPTMQPRGIWGLGWDPRWRLPVIVAFLILSFLFSAWPSTKNLGTLIGCSASVMVAAQFWHGYGGGLYIAWFLPLLLLTIFRPNLQDRVAVKVVERGNSITSKRARAAGQLSGI